jgi:hypothetical protein
VNSLMARCSRLFPSLRRDWYAIPLRLIVGYGFMEHGYAVHLPYGFSSIKLQSVTAAGVSPVIQDDRRASFKMTRDHEVSGSCGC